MPTLILDEIHKPHSIIALLPRIKSNGFFIIEPIGIRIWKESSDNPNSTSDSILFHRTLGYNIAGFYHFNKVLQREFLFILKNNGTFQILNDQLQIIDSIETNKAFENNHEYIFKYDEINNHLYLNLSTNIISRLSFKIDRNNLRILRNKKSDVFSEIYTFSGTIIDFDVSYHYNEYILEEFQTIAVLLKANNSNTSSISIKIIYRVNSKQNTYNDKWHILLPNMNLGINNIEKPSFKKCLIDTISDVGFIIFTSKGFVFLTLPHGPQNIINGSVIQDIYDQRSVFKNTMDNTNNVHDDMLTKFSSITLRKNITTNSIIYQILTDNGIYSTIDFTKIQEEDEQYIIYWKQDLQSYQIPSENDNTVAKTYFLKSTTYDYVSLTTEGNLVIHPFDNKTPPRILPLPPLPQKVSIYPSISSNILNDYICTGLTSSKKTFLHMIQYDFKDYFTYQKNDLYQVSTSPEGGNIDKSILYKISIRKANDQSTCQITNDMSIEWSKPFIKRYRLKSFDIKDKIVLDSVQSFDGHNITIVGINNDILIIDNCISLSKKVKLQINTKIASIYLQEHIKNGVINRSIWVSDYNCFIWIIDYDAGKVKDKFKLHYKVLKFCDPISASSTYTGPIIYGNDCIILSKMDINFDRFKLIWLADIPFKFNELTVNSKENKLQAHGDHCYDLSLVSNRSIKQSFKTLYLEDNHYILKYIRLSPCSPFLVCVTCDPTLNTTYLKLFNIHEKRFVQSINITKLYPQSLVSDIKTVPYLQPPRDELEFKISCKENSQYAERIILDQCFIISLNYEMAENETDHNLLLYILDDDVGEIIYQNGIHTGSSITCLQNYLENYFFIGGATLEIFKINYSVKWNSFIIKSISNPLNIYGLIKGISILDDKKESDPSRKNILLLDILRGLRNVSLTINSNISKNNNNDDESIYELQYVTSFDEHAIVNDNNHCDLITNFETIYKNGNRWFILSLDSNKIKIYYKDAESEEYESIEFYLPNEILNITTTNDLRYYYSGYKGDSDLFYRDILFLITTRNGGIYSISQEDEVIRLSRWKRNILKQQLTYITEEEIDTDDDEDDSGAIKIIDSQIILEYSL